jgi:hypothetical protein
MKTRSISIKFKEKDYYPLSGEIVYGYDEEYKIWCQVSYRSDSNRFFDLNDGGVFPLHRMHEWKRTL